MQDRVPALGEFVRLRTFSILYAPPPMTPAPYGAPPPQPYGAPAPYGAPPPGMPPMGYAPQGPPPESISGGMKILLYLLSFCIPLAGFIIGFIYYGKPDPVQKSVGKTCIMIALWPIICCLIVFVFLGSYLVAYGGY